MEDINNIDYTIDSMFNSDGTIKKRTDTKVITNENNRVNKVIDKSTKCRPVKNIKKSRQKPRGTSDLAKKAIIFIALGAGLTIGAHEFKTQADIYKGTLDVKGDIGTSVTSNTEYYGYNKNEEKPYWDYDTENIAKDILNENKEYDIDTRIYGCYTHLNEYQKEEFMDGIFKKMSKLISEAPENYNEDEIKSCLHSSFSEYLDSKGVTLEDYSKIMEKVIRAYAKEEINEEEISNLLGELNGGSR